MGHFLKMLLFCFFVILFVLNVSNPLFGMVLQLIILTCSRYEEQNIAGK